jgi:hypothetical protein
MMVDRERDYDIVEIGQVGTAAQILLPVELVAVHQAEIHHEGKGIPCGDRSRVENIQIPVVPGCDSNSAHSLVVSGSGIEQVSDSVHRIRREPAVRAVLGRSRQNSRTHKNHCCQYSFNVSVYHTMNYKDRVFQSFYNFLFDLIQNRICFLH